ncbi:MAG: hypothetical protein ACRCYS_07830, partial [Beijerinckiaceae bacterium]
TTLSPVVAAGDEWVTDSVVAHNTSAATVTVTWHLVPNGGTATAANQIYKAAIPADGLDFSDGLLSRVVPVGASIQAIADAVGVNSAATGRKLQP